ncbi:unnamed protein product [Alopecurus aequalis]
MAAPPPRLLHEIVEEILLRLPPDDPACLLRASLVCKTWGCAICSPAFCRRLHERHRTPPFSASSTTGTTKKSPASSPPPPHPSPSPPRIAAPGAQRHILVPPSDSPRWPPNATVICAADGCNHRDCHWGPFHLVYFFVVVKKGTDDDADEYQYVTSACLYLSETDAWGELTSMHRGFYIDFTFSSSVLVGRSLLYFISDDCRILEYDLARHGLTVFDPPESKHNYYDYDGCRFTLMLGEDGSLGLCQAVMLVKDGCSGLSQPVDPHLKLWSRKASGGTNAQWIVSRVIYLENLLPEGALVDAAFSLGVFGFAEGTNVIFVVTTIGLFTIELQ